MLSTLSTILCAIQIVRAYDTSISATSLLYGLEARTKVDLFPITNSLYRGREPLREAVEEVLVGVGMRPGDWSMIAAVSERQIKRWSWE